MKFLRSNSGFTLIEILLVVAAIAILAGIVILAINPNKQLGETRNAQRRSDVNTILNAVYQYSIDTGTLPSSVVTSTTEICRSTVATSTCVGYINLTDALVANEKYLTALPVDPTGSSTTGTGYFISKSANNRVTVSAPNAEQSATINATR
ncbi:MAG: hypothetical protein RIQ54_284 [Candidatus Parcubacteria bacterium]|jgi:prepilin-type N-terminal cleavage/methylation domain-containing protein